MPRVLKPRPKRSVGLKAWVLKLIFSRVGPAVKAGVSALLGWLVTHLAGLGIVLDADLQLHITSAITGLAWLAMDWAINNYAGNHAAAIQTALGVERDRWLGPVTVNTAETLADKIKSAKPPTQILD